MKELIILTFALLISFVSSANVEISNKTSELSVTVESTVVCDKRSRKAKRKRRKWNRRFNVPKSNCNKRKKIRKR
tara:strand:- start:1846 stop:2070 length:225 start_codon:yes stop_codon:yes gene_type:complete